MIACVSFAAWPLGELQARALAEAQAQIETLRLALNEARQNPTTTYPAVTF